MLQDFLSQWNAVGDLWLDWMIRCVVSSTLALTGVGLLWVLLRKRATPQLGYLLFLLIPLKLLIPLEIAVPASWLLWKSPASSNSVQLRTTSVTTSPAANSSLPVSFPSPRTEVSQRTISVRESAIPSDISSSSLAQKASPIPITVPVPFRPRLSSWLMLGWLLGITGLSIQFLLTQLRLRRILLAARAVEPAALPVNWESLCQQMHIRQHIRIVSSDEILSPAISGIKRPILLLPTGLPQALSPAQLEWVLLHELAHVRRRDLLLNLMQRLVTIIHFINPAVWIVNRVIGRLREDACDDLASASIPDRKLVASEAFLGVMRYATARRKHRQSTLQGALGIFHVSAKTSTLRRMQRLLDVDRSVRVKLGMGSIGVVLLTAAIALPQIRAAQERPKSSTPTPILDVVKKSLETDKDFPRRLELTITDPNGIPIPRAVIEYRRTQQDWKLMTGDVVKKRNYGTEIRADDSGKLVLVFSEAAAKSLAFGIELNDYAPFWLEWDSQEHPIEIPASYTVKLSPGVTVGGIITDEQGRPIPNVEVRPSIRFQKRAGDDAKLGMGARFETDASGAWTCHTVPASLERLYLEIDHPDFQPQQVSLPLAEITLKESAAPTKTITLTQGLVVTGTVTNQQGTPIANALVRADFRNDERSAVTDANGHYQIVGCEPRLTNLVATASGYALDMQNVNIVKDMSSVNFQLEPGHVIRVRALDQNGQPAPKARIFFQGWRNTQAYFAFRKVNQYADQNGLWEWREAPADEFTADICPPNGMQLKDQPLIAREEEYVFHTFPALVVTGHVVDALSQQPIPKFHVLPGTSRTPRDSIFWSAREGFDASQGQFLYKNDDGFSTLQLKVSADGYLPFTSRSITDKEGRIELKFELQRGNDLAPVVLMPDGKPAVGAKVALGLEGTQIMLKNGEFTQQTFAEIHPTDDEGRVRFPAQSGPYQLIITHPQGYAQVAATANEVQKSIQLEPWCQVEGIYLIGQTAGKNLPMAIHYYPRSATGGASLCFQQETSTDQEGRFHFDRVIPGKGRVGRELVMMVNEGAAAVASTRMEYVEFPAGKTVNVQIGGSGRPVTGRLQVPSRLTSEQAAILWKFTTLFVLSPQTEIASGFQPDPADDDSTAQKKYQQWLDSPAGHEWNARYLAAESIRERLPGFRTTVSHDGQFRIEDVPAGTYELRSMMGSPPSSSELRKSSEGIYHIRFTVPEISGGSSREPLELGTLKFESNP